jgi:very-short-patch-repair endonuclease
MATNGDKARVAAVAARHHGRIACWHITRLGIASSTVARWLAQAYLHRRLPRVYAVGHAAPSVEGDLAEALLYAGPGAALSHATAAWWLDLLDKRPRTIQVSTPRHCRSLPRIKVYGRRRVKRVFHNGLPTTTLAQLFLDLAATESLPTVRRALANADYHDRLDLAAVEATMRRGVPGTTKLRQALKRHQPMLARTKSRTERLLIEICETHKISLPETNVYVAGWQVDALWREARLAVELDGRGNHHTLAQIRRDRLKDMELRQADHTPIRYSEDQLKNHTEAVVAELVRFGAAPASP